MSEEAHNFQTLETSGLAMTWVRNPGAELLQWLVAGHSACDAGLFQQSNIEAFVLELKIRHGEDAATLVQSDDNEFIVLVNPADDDAIGSARRIAADLEAGDHHLDPETFQEMLDERVQEYWCDLTPSERIALLLHLGFDEVELGLEDSPPACVCEHLNIQFE